jgi:hypothetical protein
MLEGYSLEDHKLMLFNSGKQFKLLEMWRLFTVSQTMQKFWFPYNLPT